MYAEVAVQKPAKNRYPISTVRHVHVSPAKLHHYKGYFLCHVMRQFVTNFDTCPDL